jgi:hypothetical protein
LSGIVRCPANCGRGAGGSGAFVPVLFVVVNEGSLAGAPAAGRTAGTARGGGAELGGALSVGAERDTIVASPSSSSSK